MLDHNNYYCPLLDKSTHDPGQGNYVSAAVVSLKQQFFVFRDLKV